MTKKEFERLQPGQLIQNKKDNKWCFVVHQNFGVRVTAVRTIEIRDPEDWEVVTEVKLEEKTLRDYQDVYEGDPLSVHDCGYPRGKHKVNDKGDLVCPTPPHEDPKFKLAAHLLHEKLKGISWYHMVGMGDYELIIYTYKKKGFPKDITEFEGYPVKYTYMGKIVPATA